MTGNKEQALLYVASMPEDVILTISKFKPKRSPNQNAYYWKLATELANYNNIDKTEQHNILLRRYGQPLEIAGERTYVFIPDTDEAEEQALKAETFHIKPTSQVKEGKGGINYRAYVNLLGSSHYNSTEMYHLLQGLIMEAQNAGINTLTPKEIARMKAEDEAIEKMQREKRNSR